MEKSRRPRWLKWVLWTPIVLAVLGFGAMVVAERRIDSEIEREVAALLKMGVDVRPITPERDAGPDYARLVETLMVEKERSGISEQTLSSLEAAAHKPFAALRRIEGMFEGVEAEVTYWISAKFRESSAKRDFAMMNRLSALTKVFEAQVLGGSKRHQTFIRRVVEFPARPSGDDLQVLAWHREELEKFDFDRLLRAELSSIGRQLQFLRGGKEVAHPGALIVPGSSSPSKSWWEKAVESQVMFRKASGLAALRSVRKVSEMLRRMTPQSAANLEIEAMVASELDRQGTWQARVAREKLDTMQTGRALLVYYALITIDLRESRVKNLPLKPTWSEKYCADPTNGLPLKVRATKSDLMIVGKNSSFSTSW